MLKTQKRTLKSYIVNVCVLGVSPCHIATLDIPVYSRCNDLGGKYYYIGMAGCIDRPYYGVFD